MPALLTDCLASGHNQRGHGVKGTRHAFLNYNVGSCGTYAFIKDTKTPLLAACMYGRPPIDYIVASSARLLKSLQSDLT